MSASRPPRVSFLISVYNDARYLPATLASMLAQTMPDFEIVAVDDASTDDTPQILQSTGDRRLRYVRNQTNLGQVPSLNRGLRLCRAGLVARIDGDDICEPERLAEQLKYLEAHPDVCGCATWTTEIGPDDRVIGFLEPFNDPDHVRWSMCHTLRLYHPTMTVRRQTYLEAGGYDELYPSTEDYELWTRLVGGGARLGVVPRRLVRYRRRPGSITANNADRQRRVGGQIAARYIGQILGRPASVPTVNLMRSLLSCDPLEPSDGMLKGIRQALRMMADLRRQTLANASQAARAAADAEVADRLLEHGRRLLKHAPEESARLGLYLMRLAGHRRTGARLFAAASRCVTGRLRKSISGRSR